MQTPAPQQGWVCGPWAKVATCSVGLHLGTGEGCHWAHREHLSEVCPQKRLFSNTLLKTAQLGQMDTLEKHENSLDHQEQHPRMGGCLWISEVEAVCLISLLKISLRQQTSRLLGSSRCSPRGQGPQIPGRVRSFSKCSLSSFYMMTCCSPCLFTA